MEDNILLKTDSYKISHHCQYPPNVISIYSYLESRGGAYPELVFFGLQYVIKKHLVGCVITQEKLDEAAQFWKEHFGYEVIDREMWQYIIDTHKGHLPIRIKAVPEGTVVPTRNVLLTIENTDPKCAAVTSFLETILLHVWYPITIATNSRESKKILVKHALKSGDVSLVNTKLHDFGFRGVSSYETAAIGACAHLTSFRGTDTIAGCVLARNYYNTKEIAGISIPASEHSTMVSWGRDKEEQAYANMLDAYPNGLISCVSDSYNVYEACSKIWGENLREKILGRNGTLVIRADSGDPIEVLIRLLNILYEKFGGIVNEKGYKLLDPHIRLIQGDGITIKTIESISKAIEEAGFSIDNLVFGSGGGLLQKFDRDTMKFAIKCSYVQVEGSPGYAVVKDPITDVKKRNKPGRLKLVKDNEGNYTTINNIENQDIFDQAEDQLVTVYENGVLLCDYAFEDIRKRCDIDPDKVASMAAINLN